MALIILMVFNAPIMAISLNQPNSSHSINEAPGLLYSINTQRHTTFWGPLDSNSDTQTSSNSWTTWSNPSSPPPNKGLSPDSGVPST